MKLKSILFLVFIISISSCSERNKQTIISEEASLNGTYYYRSDSSASEQMAFRKKIIHGFNENFWEITIDNTKGWIRYIESRGFGNFDLAVSVEKLPGNRLNLLFDSLAYKSDFMPTAIDSLRKKDLVLELISLNNKLYSGSEILNFYENDRRIKNMAIFQRITN